MHCYASTSQVDGGWGLWRGSTQQHTLWEGYFILPYVGNCYCTFAHLWTAPVEGGWIIALFKSPIMSHLSGRSRVVPKVPRHHLSCSSRFLAYQSAIRTIGYALHRSPALPYTMSVQHGRFIIPSEARLYSGSIEICRRHHRCGRQPEVGLKISPQWCYFGCSC